MSQSKKLGQGIEPGNWDYIREAAVAKNYDAVLVGNPIAAQDDQILSRYIERLVDLQTKTFVDFGCGTGRSLIPAIQMKMNCIGIDLSNSMLAEAKKKMASTNALGRIVWIQSNLLELQWLSSNCVDLGVCLFSTFGMIRGRKNRVGFLQQVARSLSPNGTFLVHGHSLWFQTKFPGGKRWLVWNWLRSIASRKYEFGDRHSDSQGVKQLFLHSFTLRAFSDELKSAGLAVKEIHAIQDLLPNGENATPTPMGWIIACGKKS